MKYDVARPTIIQEDPTIKTVPIYLVRDILFSVSEYFAKKIAQFLIDCLIFMSQND